MRRCVLALILMPICAAGCSQESTTQLIENAKSADELTRIKAVRTLSQRRGEAARVVPALIEALGDDHADVRRAAALSLGTFGADALDAVPALQAKARDPDPGMRKAVATALSHIDATRFPLPKK